MAEWAIESTAPSQRRYFTYAGGLMMYLREATEDNAYSEAVWWSLDLAGEKTCFAWGEL